MIERLNRIEALERERANPQALLAELRESLTYLLGDGDGAWAACLRAAMLLGEEPNERARLFARLREGAPPPELVRRALVEAVMHGDRAVLIASVDAAVLGTAPRPAGFFTLRAAS